MFRRDRETRPAALRILLALWLVSATASVASGERRLSSGPDATTALEAKLSKALSDAESKLARDRCLQVFSDFRDASGRTLRANLDGFGRTGGSYLQWMVFFDGYGKPRCEKRGTLAWTSPNSRVVYLCSPQFLEKVLSNPWLASTLIIHEELHSLGLQEDPPTSKEITAKVIERCGR